MDIWIYEWMSVRMSLGFSHSKSSVSDNDDDDYAGYVMSYSIHSMRSLVHASPRASLRASSSSCSSSSSSSSSSSTLSSSYP